MKKTKLKNQNDVEMVKIPVFSTIKVVNGKLIGVTEKGVEKPLEWFDNQRKEN